eukprot:gene41448-56076_t
MKDSNRSKLDEILSRHDRRMSENAQRQVNEAKAKEDFVRAFLEQCMSVIRPAMMEIGEILKARGHEYKIVDNLTKKVDGTDMLKIDFQIFNNDNRNYSAIEVPHISFVADRMSRNIRVDETAKETSSSRDDRVMTIEQMTMDVVQTRILRVVDYAFR